jgi:hypothetical protein
MSINIPFVSPGGVSAHAANAANLGKKVVVDGKIYVFAKAAAAIADAPGRAVETAYVAGVPNWNVDIPASAVSCGFGIIPSNQVGSNGSTTALVSGDYFLLQVSGPAACLSGTTLIDTSVVQAGLAASSVGCMVAYAASSAGDIQNLRNTSYITNSAVVAVSGAATCVLSGLV